MIAQTTFPTEEATTIRQAIATCNPDADIAWVDTICQPTKDRQQALVDLLGVVDAVVVVGGSNSHNTQRLMETCCAWHSSLLGANGQSATSRMVCQLQNRWAHGWHVHTQRNC